VAGQGPEKRHGRNQERAIGLRQGYLQGVVVDNLNALGLGGPAGDAVFGPLDQLKEVLPNRLRLRVKDGLDGEFNVVGGEGLAVVPLDVLVEVKRVRKAVRGDLPLLGQVWNRLAVVRVDVNDVVKDPGDNRRRK
jgi:hypothetical protein